MGSETKKVLILFDVDGTITPARANIEDEMDKYLQKLRKKFTIGLVGGSDIAKIAEQTLPPDMRDAGEDPIEICIGRYDYVFAENGLDAYKNGVLLKRQSIRKHLGDDNIERLKDFCLAYMENLTLPFKSDNFFEERNGLVNICPCGRNCTTEQRKQFNEYDNEHKIREKFIERLEKEFGPNSEYPLNLKYAIGGQISFDAYPEGWDKTACLALLDFPYEKIYFFGDKTHPGGNDHEIYSDPRTLGHSVKEPSETLSYLRREFLDEI